MSWHYLSDMGIFVSVKALVDTAGDKFAYQRVLGNEAMVYFRDLLQSGNDGLNVLAAPRERCGNDLADEGLHDRKLKIVEGVEGKVCIGLVRIKINILGGQHRLPEGESSLCTCPSVNTVSYEPSYESCLSSRKYTLAVFIYVCGNAYEKTKELILIEVLIYLWIKRVKSLDYDATTVRRAVAVFFYPLSALEVVFRKREGAALGDIRQSRG